MAAKLALADVPLTTSWTTRSCPDETDEVTRLILDTHDAAAFAPVAALTVGGFRDFLLRHGRAHAPRSLPGVTPEMAAAVSKLMGNKDLIPSAAGRRSSPAAGTPSGGPGVRRPGAAEPPGRRPGRHPASRRGAVRAAGTR